MTLQSAKHSAISRLTLDAVACCAILLDLLLCLLIPHIRELNDDPSIATRLLASRSLFLTVWAILMVVILACIYLHLRMLVHFGANPEIPIIARIVAIPFFFGLIWVASPLYYFLFFRRADQHRLQDRIDQAPIEMRN
jgi:hypothetical protein